MFPFGIHNNIIKFAKSEYWIPILAFSKPLCLLFNVFSTKMCPFDYNHFGVCGHRVIDASGYCEKARWRAGMTGKLIPCDENVFKYHVTRAHNQNATLPAGFTPEVVATYAWMGVEGMCKSCTRQQKVCS